MNNQQWSMSKETKRRSDNVSIFTACQSSSCPGVATTLLPHSCQGCLQPARLTESSLRLVIIQRAPRVIMTVSSLSLIVVSHTFQSIAWRLLLLPARLSSSVEQHRLLEDHRDLVLLEVLGLRAGSFGFAARATSCLRTRSAFNHDQSGLAPTF